ncbi:protein-glutamine gamma-glutamyltransferase 2-like [Sphaerodactylus townsendi]|uniref:protein-glutamine gamma-glutamyltransferase 2-like n=1 Tax=Sphaerodactylus townsendi TaxID=933632 RepID=UPI0020268003|nr:protein-glutamine gamma-glutamyltransferase 2-like [Sphaerodactylus townsendi]
MGIATRRHHTLLQSHSEDRPWRCGSSCCQSYSNESVQLLAPERRQAAIGPGVSSWQAPRKKKAVLEKVKLRKAYPPAEAEEGVKRVNNNADRERTCRLMFGARVAGYNGTLGPECGSKDLLNVSLPPYAEKSVPLRILYEKYGGCLTQDNMIKAMAVLQDYETREIVLGVRNIYVKNPDIRIRVRQCWHFSAQRRTSGH